ncbi:hypothetical protein [Stieleria varia]|uniref:Uncharacterized protein n=1 Tax=Stieleria varia TaxID=2528005 RepID=A0A5C6BA20_9BACT|nr:hypothetical protein [Stieleria varia]TWU08281.1 hypothetical protein Pla52n_08630 [Stieleria varia]
MSDRKKNKESRTDPHEHWSYRMISALCGCLLGACFGSTCLFLIGIAAIPLVLTVIGVSAITGAIIAYRFPYAPNLLHMIADWLK